MRQRDALGLGLTLAAGATIEGTKDVTFKTLYHYALQEQAPVRLSSREFSPSCSSEFNSPSHHLVCNRAPPTLTTPPCSAVSTPSTADSPQRRHGKGRRAPRRAVAAIDIRGRRDKPPRNTSQVLFVSFNHLSGPGECVAQGGQGVLVP